MIRLTKLNGEEIFLNYFQVLYIRQIPETKIKLANGDFYLVRDSVESIVKQVREIALPFRTSSIQEKMFMKSRGKNRPEREKNCKEAVKRPWI